MSRHGSRFGADTPIFVGGISGAAGHNMSPLRGLFFVLPRKTATTEKRRFWAQVGAKPVDGAGDPEVFWMAYLLLKQSS